MADETARQQPGPRLEAIRSRACVVTLAPALHVVATPIGNLGDVTLRALSTLASADHVYCEDTRISSRLLDAYGIRRPLRTYHEHNAESVRPQIVGAITEGKSVALISDAGTPLISDPGYKLVREVQEAGLQVVAVPGPSALAAALSIAGLPTDTVTFLGFLPQKSEARRSRLAQFAAVPTTLVHYESPNRLADCLADAADVLGAREAAVARELTKRFEEVRRASLPDLATWASTAEVKGEIVVLIAPPGDERVVSDDDIRADLALRLADSPLSRAAKATAAALGVAKSRVYAIGLATREDGDA